MDRAAIVPALGNWTLRPGPLYRRLTEALIEAIRQGWLPAGARLPADRELAVTLAVSRNTVVSAYEAARGEGWLERRPGSGTRVAAARARPAVAAAQREALGRNVLLGLLDGGAETIDFAMGTPLPLAELADAMFSLPASAREQFLEERSFLPLGLPALREAIAAVLSRQGVPTTPAQILVCSGAQQAISLSIGLLVQRGAPVLVENPTYFGALEALRLAGAQLEPLELGPRHIDPRALAARLAATGARMVYLTPTFHNPTGATLPETAREAVARAVARAGAVLVEDQTLGELALDGPAPRAVAAFAGAAPVLTIGSLSKLYWSGLRIGWIRAPEPVIGQLARIKSTVDLGAPLFTQAIAARLLAGIDEARTLRRAQLRARREFAAARLRERLPDWEITLPAGGLFFWVKTPVADTARLAQVAARHGVVLTTGAMFTVDGASRCEYLRVPFLLPEAALGEGIDRLAAAWAEVREKGSTFGPGGPCRRGRAGLNWSDET